MLPFSEVYTTDLMLNMSCVMVDFSSFFTYHTIGRGERGDDGLSAYQKNTFYLKEPLFTSRNFCALAWRENKIIGKNFLYHNLPLYYR